MGKNKNTSNQPTAGCTESTPEFNGANAWMNNELSATMRAQNKSNNVEKRAFSPHANNLRPNRLTLTNEDLMQES
jgi:hypothetical protein